jgi:hypothetical protein
MPAMPGPDRKIEFASRLLLAWSLLYAIPHLYWGLGGTFGFFALKPSATEVDNFEAANILAAVLIAFAGVLGFALGRFQPGKLRLLLLATTGIGAAVAGAHGLYGIAFRISQVTGVTAVEGQHFTSSAHEWVLWDLFTIEPWFLIEGVLLAIVGLLAQRSIGGRRLWLCVVGSAFVVALATAAVGVRAG